MPICEMCGYVGQTFRAIVEGSMLDACSRCVGYGQAIEIKNPPKQQVEQRLKFRTRRSYGPVSQESELIVSNFHDLIKRARSKTGKNQEEVSKDLAIRASVLQKIENGSMEPPLKLARKLEQYFKVKLVKKQEKVAGEVVKEFNVKDSSVTIGDLIKFKK
jgi:putative transcription factor